MAHPFRKPSECQLHNLTANLLHQLINMLNPINPLCAQPLHHHRIGIAQKYADYLFQGLLVIPHHLAKQAVHNIARLLPVLLPGRDIIVV